MAAEDQGKDKLFIIRKYVFAASAAAAIAKDSTLPVDDCWIDDEWKKKSLADALGYRTIDPDQQKPS